MSLAACCTSASSWSSVMSRDEREKEASGLDAHLGLCAIWMDFMVDWISSLRSTRHRGIDPFNLPASSIVGLAGASRTIAFGIGFFSLGFFFSASLASTGCAASIASIACKTSDFLGAARRLVRCFDGGRNVLRISSRVHVFFSSFLPAALFAFVFVFDAAFFVDFFFWEAGSVSSPTTSRGFGNRDAFFFFSSSRDQSKKQQRPSGVSVGSVVPLMTALYCSSRIRSCMSAISL